MLNVEPNIRQMIIGLLFKYWTKNQALTEAKPLHYQNKIIQKSANVMLSDFNV